MRPKTRLNFYSTEHLLFEIGKHKKKIREISNYTDLELERSITLITNKIRFINIKLIPKEFYVFAGNFTHNIDIYETEFVALTGHIKGKLWSGDKILISGLNTKGWRKIITNEELFESVNKLRK